LPETKARALYAVQWPFHKALLTGKTKHAAWRSKPSWYAVSTEDRAINRDLERFMAKRMARENDRGQGEPRFANIAARDDCKSDSGGGWTRLERDEIRSVYSRN
jgi:hypothetical protein